MEDDSPDKIYNTNKEFSMEWLISKSMKPFGFVTGHLFLWPVNISEINGQNTKFGLSGK